MHGGPGGAGRAGAPDVTGTEGRATRRLSFLGIATVALVLAAVVGLAAVIDHRDKQERMNRAERSEWYCEHVGTRCRGASSARIERRWNERQIGYEAAVGVLVGVAALGLAIPLLGRARVRSAGDG
jgi:hypothetical protein